MQILYPDWIRRHIGPASFDSVLKASQLPASHVGQQEVSLEREVQSQCMNIWTKPSLSPLVHIGLAATQLTASRLWK